MSAPSAPPIRLAISNPNPNPNPKSNNNVCSAKRHRNKVQDSVINISYFRRAGGYCSVRLLGVINRCFLNKTKDILVSLYKSLVRSRLEYCVQAWRPYLVKDIELMEKVQKRMTRMLPDHSVAR